MLFEVDTADGKLEFGGFPYHFIVNPVKKANVADVRRVSNNSLVHDTLCALTRDRTEKLLYETIFSTCMQNVVCSCSSTLISGVERSRGNERRFAGG